MRLQIMCCDTNSRRMLTAQQKAEKFCPALRISGGLA
jgi:hypothetical protein